MRFCILNGPCWYLVETSGDLAPLDDAVRKELALRLPGLEKTWQRPPSFTSQPSYRIARPQFILLPAPTKIFSLHPAQSNITFSITSSLLLCLPTYCNCILLFFYTSASSTTSQSQNEDFNCSPRCRCELRRCPEHQ